VAAAALADFEEIGGFPEKGRVLVLAGKGHNGGDSLIAARTILERFPGARAEVLFALGERALRPLARRAWRELVASGGRRVSAIHFPLSATGEGPGDYALSLDGLFGTSFRPPIPAGAAAALAWANGLPIALRAAVDLPSGLGEAGAFRADFTYATGVAKAPLLECENAGRPRYVDLGFFAEDRRPDIADRVLTPSILAPLRVLREPHADKRSFGHLLILGGSRDYPGSVLMAALAALRSGAGLVTVFVPRSLAAAFAARAPEAMWVGWPETAAGGLAAAGYPLFEARMEKATAVAVGPGLGNARETHELVARMLGALAGRRPPAPVLVDADALQPDLVRIAGAPLVLTPHRGEYSRIAGAAPIRDFCRETGATVLLKGPVTRIAACSGGRIEMRHSFFGGPALARGGSGDVLAGLIGGLLAREPADPFLAACQGAAWHGRAADFLARARGQEAVSATQLLDFLPDALRRED
jgi:NAD(P)H-hydrate epimerase